MIFYGENLLNGDELFYVNDLLNDFTPDEVPEYKKFSHRRDYYRQLVELPNSLNEKIIKIVKETTGRDVTIAAAWINRIDSNSNQSDDFHRDDTDLSFVLYPSKNFSGGNVQYVIGSETHSFNVSDNSYIMMTNKIKHKVEPTTNGVRWSIALFCYYTKDRVALI